MNLNKIKDSKEIKEAVKDTANKAKSTLSKIVNNAPDIAIIPTSVALTTVGTAVTITGNLITRAGLEVGKLSKSGYGEKCKKAIELGKEIAANAVADVIAATSEEVEPQEA